MTRPKVMKLIKKTLAGLLLLFGVPLSIGALIDIVHPETPTEVRRDAELVLFSVTLPSTVAGSWLIWSVVQQNRREASKKQQEEEDRLRQVLFDLLESENGTVTVIKFAMKAQISGEVAKQYLDFYAEKYIATFEVDDLGNIYYQFSLN